MNTLETQFTDALLFAVDRARKECKYNPSYFLQMINEHGSLETARKLIHSNKISDGFEKLWELKRLDLTVEAISLQPKWKPLFTPEELAKAQARMIQFGYIPKETNEGSTNDGMDNNVQNDRKPWTQEELSEAVDAYLQMLEKEIKGELYNKAEVNRNLRNEILKDRNKSSIEFRMQNISSVMEALCLPRIKGYLPAKNIGSKVFSEIASILENRKYFEKVNYEPTDDLNEFEKRVSRLSLKIQTGKPMGVINPEKILQQNIYIFKRDPLIKAWVLKNAKGKCEKCNNEGPFTKDDGTVYLEVHHLTSLSDGGNDTIVNTLALCPNCHREMHYSKDRDKCIRNLINQISRMRKE